MIRNWLSTISDVQVSESREPGESSDSLVVSQEFNGRSSRSQRHVSGTAYFGCFWRIDATVAMVRLDRDGLQCRVYTVRKDSIQ